MKNSDAQLIHRVLNGDETAFSELVKKYQKQVHALAWRKIGDFHIAEEITQDTFLKAYQKLRTLKKPQRFASWLYVIATNRCNTWLHKKHFRTQLLRNKGGARPEKASYSEYVVEENERISVETQREVVKKLLAKLEESERTVMTLHYFAEMSCTEIGAFLGVSANTIKSRLRRAQQRLKKDELMIREALDNFQISPNLTENVMREISRIKPAAPSGGKPFVPWAVAAASTLTVMLLMFGFGNHQYLTRFQQPYSFDATTEMTVEIVDAPIVANLESKPDVRKQIGNVNALDKQNHPQQPNDAPAAITEAQGDEIVTDYTQWELPEKAKARLGKGWINAIQFSPDGTQLAVGGGIGVWLYDVRTGKEISLFPGICRALAFSPDGRFLVNGGGDATTLWEVATGRKVTRHDSLPGTPVLWFSKDSKTLVTLNASEDTTICWIDTDTGKSTVKKIENRLDSHPRAVYALTHDKVAIAENSGILALWNAKSGKKVSTLTGPAERLQAEDVQGIEFNRVISLAFSPDGTRLASGKKDRTVRLWDTTGNNEPILLQKQSLSPDLLRSTQELVDGPNVLLFSPDGRILACGEGQNVKLWDITTGELITTFRGHIGLVDYLAFSPDGSILASASEDGTVLYWNINPEDPLPPNITEHTHQVETISFMNGGSSTLASVAYSGIITLYDLETSQRTTHRTKTAFENTRYSLEAIPLAFSPDGTKLASKGILNTPTAPLGTTPRIRLIDVTTGRELTSLTYSNENVTPHLTFSPDGKTAVFSAHRANYGKIRLWNTETDKILDIRFSDKAAWIQAAAFSPDGNKFVAGTSDGKVQMWDAKTGVHLTSFFDKKPPKSGALMNLTFSSDGALLAVMYMRQIHLLGSPKIPHFKEISSEPDMFWDGLVFSPDNTVLILSLIDGGIQLRDVTTGKVLNTLDGHTCSPEAFSFSPDGKTLVSAGSDGTILLWDWEEVLEGIEGTQVATNGF